MKYYQYDEPDNQDQNSIIVKSEDEIIQEYWGYWSAKMKLALVNPQSFFYNKSDLMNKERCIYDWVTVNWAWEIKPKTLLIDPLKDMFKFAILKGTQVINRGDLPSMEDLRELEKKEGVNEVYIDSGYLCEKCHAANILWDWINVKFKSDQYHFIDDAIYHLTETIIIPENHK